MHAQPLEMSCSGKAGEDVEFYLHLDRLAWLRLNGYVLLVTPSCAGTTAGSYSRFSCILVNAFACKCFIC